VIKVDPRTKKVSVDKRGVRGETMGREVLRHPDLAKYVKLARVRDHFICALSLPQWGVRTY
jgi:DNA-directed RNA polymerases I and III subunit RPAC1